MILYLAEGELLHRESDPGDRRAIVGRPRESRARGSKLLDLAMQRLMDARGSPLSLGRRQVAQHGIGREGSTPTITRPPR